MPTLSHPPVSTLDPAFQTVLSKLPGYELRPAQQQMLEAIKKALASKQSLVVEAGTGSGKSLAYLLPILLQESRPVVISTATIALQEQLLEKDIPFLKAASGRDTLNVRLVKGRRNYLCLQKMLELERNLPYQASTRGRATVSSERLHLNALKDALTTGWDGDVGTLDWQVPPALWAEVASETEDCLGKNCAFYQQNPYRLSREDLDKADIIVANHALYFQDVAAGHSLLPAHDIVVFDEAHHLKAMALNAFTERIGRYATTKLLRKIQKRLQPVPEMFSHALLENEAGLLEWLFQQKTPVFRDTKEGAFRLVPDAGFEIMAESQIRVLTDLFEWLSGLDVKQLSLALPAEDRSELDEDRQVIQRNLLVGQLADLCDRWRYFLTQLETGADRVNWVEMDSERLYFELRSTPLDVAKLFEDTLWPEKTAILTSATLSVNRSLSFFCEEIGLTQPEKETVVLPSPFSYQQQCVLYLPQQMPDPNTEDFIWAMAEEVERLLAFSKGRAFVLFTSTAAMRRLADALIPKLPFPARVQGELPRHRLVDWFKNTPNSVLFATATFWEGIDIPGQALSCVIIDKIPFTSPSDPLHQATVDYLKARGKDWFTGYALPQAVLKLKQGVGRLIRSKTDCGLVAILDPRIRSKGYGRVILKSLPPMRTIHSLGELQADTLDAVFAV